jgi:hypothetical protein
MRSFSTPPGTGCVRARSGAVLVPVGRPRYSAPRTATLLVAGLGLTLLVASVATDDFTWRYRIPLAALLRPAAALAVAALARPADGERT